MQIIIQPFSADNFVDAQRWEAISKRRKEPKSTQNDHHKHTQRQPTSRQALASESLSDWPLTIVARAGLALSRSRGGTFGRKRSRRAGGEGISDGVRGVGRLDVKDEFEEGTRDQCGRQMCGKIVVQEELAAHDEEGNVVGCPDEEEETCAVVKTRACTCLAKMSSQIITFLPP